MSVHEAIAWAIEVSRGEPMPARMLLIVGLAARCGDRENGFVVWPSHKQISDDCDMSRASVKRWLVHLEETKLVEKFSATRGDGGKTSNRYRLPVKAVFHHPTKGPIERTPMAQSEPGAGVRVNHPMAHLGEPSHGSSAEPCSEQQLEQQLEGIESTPTDELDLGLPPVPPKDPTPVDVADFISEQWATRAHATPLRGGRPTEANAEKALDLGKKFAVAGQTAIDTWREIFTHIDTSDFLQGKVPGRDGRPPFKLTLTFLLEKRNFEKTLEGRFDGRTGSGGGGSTSKAIAGVQQRIRSGRGGSAGRRDSGGYDPGGPAGHSSGGPRRALGNANANRG